MQSSPWSAGRRSAAWKSSRRCAWSATPGHGDRGRRHWNNGWRIVPTADGAEARVYWIVVDVGTGTPITDRSGYYDDKYVRTADGWRIKERVITFDSAG